VGRGEEAVRDRRVGPGASMVGSAGGGLHWWGWVVGESPSVRLRRLREWRSSWSSGCHRVCGCSFLSLQSGPGYLGSQRGILGPAESFGKME
jgi:hypothetical protein